MAQAVAGAGLTAVALAVGFNGYGAGQRAEWSGGGEDDGAGSHRERLEIGRGIGLHQLAVEATRTSARTAARMPGRRVSYLDHSEPLNRQQCPPSSVPEPASFAAGEVFGVDADHPGGEPRGL